MSGRAPHIALVGNPNAGKTTLFNQLTGAQQRVGNWPGVTVEKKTGEFNCGAESYTLVDLPGTYSLQGMGDDDALDQQIARNYVRAGEAQVAVNIVDATSLERGLFVSLQLIDSGLPVVIALNMVDAAARQKLTIDVQELSARLACPVVEIVASRGRGLDELCDAISATVQGHASDDSSDSAGREANTLPETADDEAINARYQRVGEIVAATVERAPDTRRTVTDIIDSVLLNRFLAFPLFLAVMYLMFMFTINIGGAFVDAFDGVAAVVFVEAPRRLMEFASFPAWLVAFLADGVGGGMQLVASFIPIIGGLFLFQSFLEASGYMARAAFIIDRLMLSIGLPGKSFVPLLVGFGCNVPSVMGARTLDKQGDRLLTVLMAPFMSCGARLTVYVLFASVFFPKNAENVIFALYVIGIVLAVLSGLAVRKYALGSDVSPFVMELPQYHVPHIKSIFILSWQRLKGFILRAGKAIVMVVVVLNFVNSLGADGSFGNQDTEQSMLSYIGKRITPAFAPIGMQPDNWPAAVGIFTGIFAKEVVVGTLDALYGSIARSEANGGQNEAAPAGLVDQLRTALATVPTNLAAANEQWDDPLGVNVGDLSNQQQAAEAQGVTVSTLAVMNKLFAGPIAAFAYLLFVLLYMPCVATLGAIYKEMGAFWAVFSATWNTALAYAVALWFYQIGTFSAHPKQSAFSILAMLLVLLCLWLFLIYFARKQVADSQLIPVVNLR